MSGDREAAARRYAAFLEQVTADNLEQLRALTAPDVRFKDPFNDVRGQERMIRAFADLFKIARDVRFEVRAVACADQVCFILWDFACTPRRSGQTWRFRGVSEVRVDDDGRIALHIDHFDSGGQFYARLPVVGTLVRFVRRRLQIED